MDIEKLKQKILDLAIRGKLVPQDPNDEPASELIEKIRKEKEELIKQGKIKRDKNESYIYKGCNNCYYENNSTIDFSAPLDVSSNFIWIKGKHMLFPMESTKSLNNFDYIDIDAIDNKLNIIANPKSHTVETAPSRATRKIYSTSTLFSMVRPYLRNIAFVGEKYKDCIASTGFYVCTPMSFIDPEYLFILLKSDFVVNSLNFYMKGDNSPSINGGHIEEFLFPIPSLNYQRKVVNRLKQILPQIDNILLEVSDLTNIINKLKQKILDYYFGEDSCYKSHYENKLTLGDVLSYEQPWKYTVESTNYDDSYKTPVLTPGKTFILGYTNEKNGIYDVGKSKVIIFDDFTTASRLVNFNFKVKSSAMKILTSVDLGKFDIEYLFYLLQTINVICNTHKRYWISEYMPICVQIHNINEQKKIVNKINTMFTILNAMSNSI